MHLLVFFLYAQIKRWCTKNDKYEVSQNVRNFFTSVKLWPFSAILCSLSESLQEVVNYVLRVVWPPSLYCHAIEGCLFQSLEKWDRQEQTWCLSFFSTNVLLGSIFLHMKARKLWQKFRDKTAWITYLATKGHKLQWNPINCTEISPHVEKFSISPQLSYMESWNFPTWHIFSPRI